jgi:VanZ family protein
VAEALARGAWSATLARLGGSLVRRSRAFSWALVAGWMVLIFALSSTSFGTRGPRSFAWSLIGNLAHAPLFGLLALFLLAALARARPRAASGLPVLDARLSWWVVWLVAAYAASDELHQSLNPERDASWLDLATDVAAALATVGAARYLALGAASERGLRWRLVLGVVACLVPSAAGAWT